MNHSLKAWNTFGIDQQTNELVCAENEQQLLNAWQSANASHHPVLILGEGSNVLFLDTFQGTVIVNRIKGIEITEQPDAWHLHVGAGENWHHLVEHTLQQSMPGLENLALIPGTVGAAPVQNIGAYGLEVGELVARVRAWDFRRNDYVDYSREACRFAYRHSVFKEEGRHLDGSLAIVALTLRLPKRWQANCRYADVAQELTARGITQPVASDVAAAVIAVRQRKLPDMDWRFHSVYWDAILSSSVDSA